MFDRYNSVDEKDFADAAAKLDRKAQQRKRHSTGTVAPKVPAADKIYNKLSLVTPAGYPQKGRVAQLAEQLTLNQ